MHPCKSATRPSGPYNLRDCPSIQPLTDRAVAVRPDSTLDDDNAADLAGISRYLDGLPLALELAAARLRLLDPKSLHARLEKTLPLLVNPARDLPKRQETLRTAIAWRHGLFSPAEKSLFETLAVFAGGYDIEAIEAIHMAVFEESRDILDDIESLHAQSLSRYRETANGSRRNTLLETIKEFGLKCLKERTWRDRLSRQHAIYYLNLAKSGDEGLRGPKQLD